MDKLSLITGGVLVLVVLVAYLSVAFRSLRTMESIDDFFIYNRKLRDTSVFSATFSAEMSLATVFIAFMTLAAIMGLNLVFAMITFVAGQFVLWLTIPAVKRKVFWGETLQTFLGESFSSPTLRRIASATSVLGFIGLFSTEILVGTTLFTGLTGHSKDHAPIVAFVAALVVFYTTLGGFKSVVVTDRWQAAGVILVVAVLVFSAFNIGGNSNHQLIAPSLLKLHFDPLLILNFLIINTLYPICDMSAWQRIAAARDSETARRGFFAALISFFITWSAIIFAALALTEYTGGATDGTALIKPLELLANTGLTGTIVVGLALAALSAAMLSTGDTFLIAASQSLSIDILAADFFAEKREKERVASESDLSLEGNSETDSSRVVITTLRQEVYAGVPATKVLFQARLSIVAMATVGVLAFGFLMNIGFAVADFVFVVYGSTIALLPAIVGAFMITSESLRGKLATYSIMSLVLGLAAGWAYGVAAVTGSGPKLPLIGDASAYNSPTVALIVSGAIFAIGLALTGRRTS